MSSMSSYSQHLKEKVASLERDLVAANNNLEERTEQFEEATSTNAAARAALENNGLPWKWVAKGVIFLVICILSAKGDERTRVDALLDRVVSMSRSFEHFKIVFDSKTTPKAVVQTIMSIVAATNTTGACLIKG